MSEHNDTPADVEADPTRPPRRKYVAQLYGETVIVEARDHPQVKAHMARRAREHTTIRLAGFEDGVDAERMGIPVETAGETDANGDLFKDKD